MTKYLNTAMIIGLVIGIAMIVSAQVDHMINPNQQINMLLDARCIGAPGKVHVELFDCENITSPKMGCAKVYIHADASCYTPKITKRGVTVPNPSNN